jgi:hypothetical protein
LNARFPARPAGGIALMGVAAIACLLAPAPARAGELPHKPFDLTIASGAVPAGQRVLRVHRDELVRLRVTSDAPGAIHLHGYRREVTVVPGRAAELVFKAHATGRYRIEWHPVGDHASHHHGPALATLEVRPR